MNSCYKQHQAIIISSVLILLLSAAVYILFIRPGELRNIKQSELIRGQRTELTKSGWPCDPSRLNALLGTMKRDLNGTIKNPDDVASADGLQDKANLLIKAASGMFQKQIGSRFAFDTVEEFIQESNRLDFQEEFNRLEQKLAKSQIHLSDKILNLSENTTSSNIYQLILQVWTLEKLTDLASKNHLKFLTSSIVEAVTEEGPARSAAKIRLLAPRQHYLKDSKESSFLMEFPVQATLVGTPKQVSSFLLDLRNMENFLPLNHMEIMLLPHGVLRLDKMSGNGNLVVIDLECGAFFRTVNDEKELKPAQQNKNKIKTIPSGA